MFAAVVSGVGAVFYIIASVFPLIDPTCPYRTPLSRFLQLVWDAVLVGVSCAGLYVILVYRSVAKWIKNKDVYLPDISPSALKGLMTDDATAPVMPRLLKSYLKREPDEKRDQVIHQAYHPQMERLSVSINELSYLTTFTKLHLLDSPDTVRYMSRNLLDMTRGGISSYISSLLEHEGIMSKLSAVFRHIDSPLDAIGAIRFLQMLLLAINELDQLNSIEAVASNEDSRWAHLDAVVGLLPAFFDRYGELNDEALAQSDVTLLAASASLRWTLVLAMGRVQACDGTSGAPGCFAQSRLQLVMKMLQRVPSLRLCAVTARDKDDIDDLFNPRELDPPTDHRVHWARARYVLAYRNAFTLLEGARRCHWNDGWQHPDTRYLPKDTRCMWDWGVLVVPNREPKPAPSAALHAVLSDGFVQSSLAVGPGLAIHDGSQLDTIATSALRKLEGIVDRHLSFAPVQEDTVQDHGEEAPTSEDAAQSRTPGAAMADDTSQGQPTDTTTEVCFQRSPGSPSHHSSSSSSDSAKDETGPLISPITPQDDDHAEEAWKNVRSGLHGTH
ncbi:unnamed protein product [Peniophora sp. CBMAI 1063]|nr:unnamed protein product [Peniophora sp. CBMAI 1063]